MGEVFTTSGENSENIVVPTPRLQGLFVPGIDNPLAIDGFGIVTPWGGGGTSRKYSDYGISGDISRQNTQLGDLASSLIPAEGAGISYNWEGLVGPQGPAGRDGLDGIIHIMGLNLPQNSNFLAELPHNIDQINDLGTAVDKLIYTNAYNTYTDIVWTERQPAGDDDKNWRGVASDDDGSNLIAADYGGRLWISADSGATWTERRPAGDFDKDWLCVASDSDGSHLIAGIYGGRLYTSADSGASWTERQPAGDSNENWRGVASDANGSNLIAVTFGDEYYLSSDSGVNWTTKSSGFWQSTGSDSDGSNLILSSSSRLYTSANSGADWTERQPAGAVTKDWECIASDADGSNLLAGIKGGRLYTSANSGVGWTERQPAGVADKNWFCGASDSDGSHLIVGASSGRLYTSDDSGATWTEEQPAGDTSENWICVGSDADGSLLIAGAYDGRLYTGVNTTLYSEATWAEAALTSAGRALMDDATAVAQATTLGLGTSDSPTWVGATFSGLTPTYVPFIDTGGVLAEDSVFTWDKTDNYLKVGFLKLGGEHRIIIDDPDANAGLTLNAKGTGGVYFNYVDGGSGGMYFYNGATQKLMWFGGTTYGEFRGYDEDYAEWIQFACSSGYGYLEVKGTSPNPLILNNSAESDVWMFQGSTSGETQGLRVYGYKAGDAKRYLDITTGGTADDTVDFTGLSNYKFGGAGIFTGLTITGNSVFGLNSSVFQPTIDSTTFFQVLDADGGVPILNVDSINERVGIGTTAPNAPLEVKGVKPGIVGGFQSGQLQVTGSVIDEFYNAVITGHNSFNGNTQLWYLGNTSSLNNDIAFINRQNAPIHFYTNNTSRMTISAAGTITGLSTAAFEGASVTIGKASTTTGTLILHDSNSANTITLTVPDISAGSLSFTLPPTDGDNTNVLQTDGNGVLTWVAAGHVFLPFVNYNLFPDNISTSPSLPFTAGIPYNMTPDTWSQAAYVFTTNDASNYWTISLINPSASITYASFDTRADGITTWTVHSMTSFSPSVVNSSEIALYIYAVKTGSPGNLALGGPGLTLET